MTNLSVLERLEKSLGAYEQEAMSRFQFVQLLASSVHALEGVPYSVLQEHREHELAMETEGYFDDEGFESRSASAKEALRSWIQQLKGLYGSSNC